MMRKLTTRNLLALVLTLGMWPSVAQASGTLVFQTKDGATVIVPDFTQHLQPMREGQNLYYSVISQEANLAFAITIGTTDSSLSLGCLESRSERRGLLLNAACANIFRFQTQRSAG